MYLIKVKFHFGKAVTVQLKMSKVKIMVLRSKVYLSNIYVMTVLVDYLNVMIPDSTSNSIQTVLIIYRYN